MQRIIIILLVGVSAVLLGIVLGANIFTEKVSVDRANKADDRSVRALHQAPNQAAMFDELVARLEDGESQLRSHQQQLEQLNDELVLLKRASVSVAGVGQQADTEQSQVFTPKVIDVNSFLDAGFGSDQAIEFDERYADIELRRLYLRDKALREGWISEPRFVEERAKLNTEEESIAGGLGDDAYDRYLFATGQSNRVSVSSVIRKSPAETSGIEGGDVIYRYDGRRVYDSFDLRNATSEGEAGTSVAVEVLRDDNIVELYIPRGPLGVQLQSDSVKP